MKKLLVLTSTICFTNLAVAVENSSVIVANNAQVASCQLLGDSIGESRLYWTKGTGLESARREALSRAKQGGATHMVWRAEKIGSITITAIGRAYDCRQGQQSAESASNNLLSAEYTRLLGEAVQGKISYVSAFTQIDSLRLKLIPDNKYMVQYFEFMGETARKMDSKEITYEQAEAFLNERGALIAQIARQEMQQKMNANVAQQLSEDQALQMQLRQNDSANDSATNSALLGFGLGILLMNNSVSYGYAPPPSQTTYTSPGRMPVTCATTGGGAYVSCF